MSVLDVDSLGHARVTTTDATPTLVLRVPLPVNTTVSMEGLVITGQNRVAPLAAYSYVQQARVVSRGPVGGLVEIGATAPVIFDPTTLGYVVTSALEGDELVYRVTAAAGHDVEWAPSFANGMVMKNQTFDVFSAGDLAIWLRSDLGQTRTGALVNTWANQADVALLPSISAAGAARPSFNATGLNGRPTTDFNGANVMSNTMAATAQPFTTFIVMRADGLQTTLVMNGSSAFRQNTLAGGELDILAGVGITSPAATYASTVAFDYSTYFDGGTSEIFFNGTSVAGPGNAGGNGFTDFYLGAFSGGGFNLTGSIAEVLVYRGRLSVADRQAVEAYLRAEYLLP